MSGLPQEASPASGLREGRELLGDRAQTERSVAAFERRLRDDAGAEHTLRVLSELMMQARDPDSYRARRAAFLRTIREETPASGVVARVLRYFAVDVPGLTFDDRDSLVHAILDQAGSDEALVLFLLAMTDKPDSVRPILDRIAARENPFPTLGRIFTAPWLESFRHIVSAKILEAARTRPGALRNWFRTDPDTCFQREVFELLFTQATEIMSSVWKEILADGPPDQRSRLIRHLEADGTDSALRVLILGLPFGGRACEPELLVALSSFDHELAAAALREVVHCGNVAERHADDAVRAMWALEAMDNEESSEFVDQVAKARYAMFPAYRRELRKGANRIRRSREGA